MTSQPELVDAVLPAGGRLNSEFATTAGNENKALIEFGGSSILERTIRSLRSSSHIGRIVVVGPDQVKEISLIAGANIVLADQATGSANIMSGIEWLASQPNPASKVIVVTTDMPFISTTSVNQFLRLCPANCDICVPVGKDMQNLARLQNHLRRKVFHVPNIDIFMQDILLSCRIPLPKIHILDQRLGFRELAGITIYYQMRLFRRIAKPVGVVLIPVHGVKRLKGDAIERSIR